MNNLNNSKNTANKAEALPTLHTPHLLHVAPHQQNSMQMMSRTNDEHRTYNEYCNYMKEDYHKSAIINIQNQLSCRNIISLGHPSFQHDILCYLPPALINTANSLCQLTPLLSFDGICLALLGAMSCATCGRVSIELNPHWSEPAIDMQVQVAPSGFRKSAIVSKLHVPFDEFCQGKNQGYEENAAFNKIKACFMKPTAYKIASKDIKDVIKSSFENPNKNPINSQDIKLVVREAATVYQELMEDINATLKPTIQLLLDKATSFQLAKALSEQGECQACITSEGDMLQSSLLGVKGDPGLFLRCHTQEPYVYENGKQKISLQHPALPMVNFVQDTVAANLYRNDRLNEVGVLPRFMPFIHSLANNTQDSDVPENAFEDYNSLIMRMLELYQTQDKNAERYKVRITPEALELLVNFKNTIKQSIIPTMPKKAESCLQKAAGQAARFAWDIHVWNWTNENLIEFDTSGDTTEFGYNHNSQEYNDQPHTVPITATEMRQAINLMYISFDHIRYVYADDGLIAYDTAEKIVRSLMRINDHNQRLRVLYEGIDSTTLQQRVGLKSKEVNNALQLLENHNALAIYDYGSANLKVALHSNFFTFFWDVK